MAKKPAATRADATLARLQEARAEAEYAHREQQERKRALTDQVRHMRAVIDRFTRRRDRLLAAGEENPLEARPAAELAATADRLRKGAENALHGLDKPYAAAVDRSRKAGDLVARIDAALKKLEDAMKGLELARVEKENRERLAHLERTSRARLQQLGHGTASVRAGASVPPEPAQPSIESYVREVTRLAYEAEALADLQRERVL